MIKIELDEKSGFCTGVIKAVKAAEKELISGGKLYSLGELVHNRQEVTRLNELGLHPISYKKYDTLKNSKVLIRAHGEPPSTYKRAKEQNISLIDATCPIVRRLQDQVRDCWQSLEKGSILIFGKSSHPEVRALVGQTEGKAIVLRTPEELEGLELIPPVYLFSQTTMNLKDYNQFRKAVEAKLKEPGANLKVHNTICGQVSSRDKHLREFVKKYDLVFFVSGKMSSNGKALFQVCREVNPETYFISSAEESDEADLEGVASVGICGATSTPGWLMRAVKERLVSRLNITGT